MRRPWRRRLTCLAILPLFGCTPGPAPGDGVPGGGTETASPHTGGADTGRAHTGDTWRGDTAGTDSASDDTASPLPTLLSLPEDAPFQVGPRSDYAVDCPGPALDSATTIATAISSAEDGDCVLVGDGAYDIGRVLLGAQDVTVVASNRWGAVLEGSSELRITGDRALVQGFVFQGGDLDVGTLAEAIWVDADDVHLSHLQIHSWGEQDPEQWAIAIDVSSYAERLEISDSRFSDLYGIAVLAGQEFRSGYVSAKGLWIHHDEFMDNPRRWGSGGETAQVGTAYNHGQDTPGPEGAAYDDDMEMVFEYNDIVRHQAESELVSLKSGRNIIRFNRIVDCSSGALVVRMGSDNLVYGNWMVENVSSPIRISGERNVYVFNYFSGSGYSMTLHHEQIDGGGDPRLVDSYWAANDNLFLRNAFQGYDQLVLTFGFEDGFVASPAGNTIADNLLLDSSDAIGDFTGIIDAETFLADNEVSGNSHLEPGGAPGEWTLTEHAASTALLPVDLSELPNLPWTEDSIAPPEWWAELFLYAGREGWVHQAPARSAPGSDPTARP